MFTPAQIKAWRKQMEAQPELDGFDGHYVPTLKLELRQEASGDVPEHVGTFYPPERIYGQPVDSSCLKGIQTMTIMRPKGHIERLEQARVIGFTAVLSRDNRLYAPVEVSKDNAKFALARNTSGHDGFLMYYNGDRLAIRFVSRRTPRLIEMDALFLHNLEPANYGSFIFRQLPQMITARNSGLQFDCYIAERTPWLLEALSLVGLPSLPVFSLKEISGELFNSIQFCTHSDSEGFLSLEAKAGLTQLVEAAWNRGSSEPREKLYISRALSTLSRPWYRPMLNELDIEQIALRHGFHVFQPETHSLSEQIRTFSRATRVVGPSGSGMFNTVFAQTGSRVVDLETYMVTVRQHAKLYASCGHNYAFVFSHPEEGDQALLIHRRWNLSPPLFMQALQWLTA